MHPKGIDETEDFSGADFEQLVDEWYDSSNEFSNVGNTEEDGI